MSEYLDADLKAAWQEGYTDFLRNVAKLDCPYSEIEMKSAWLDGWNDAHEDDTND